MDEELREAVKSQVELFLMLNFDALLLEVLSLDLYELRHQN